MSKNVIIAIVVVVIIIAGAVWYMNQKSADVMIDDGSATVDTDTTGSFVTGDDQGADAMMDKGDDVMTDEAI